MLDNKQLLHSVSHSLLDETDVTLIKLNKILGGEMTRQVDYADI